MKHLQQEALHSVVPKNTTNHYKYLIASYKILGKKNQHKKTHVQYKQNKMSIYN